MVGSWAGAMGQSQFMPSSFLQYAVDFDGDGRRDIWTSQADVFASAANYLARNGWVRTGGWGLPVQVPAGFEPAGNSGLDVRRPVSAWQAAGLRMQGGANLLGGEAEAALVQPDGPRGDAFLAFENYRVIMRWNRSVYFATSVGLLSDRIGSAG
jgi:membrane-bound lytic murein transglycosylase B